MEELLPKVSPDRDGLLARYDYNRTVPVHINSNTFQKIVLKFTEGTIEGYAHLLVLLNESMFKINYYSDYRECSSFRLFGNGQVTFYANKEKHEIIISKSGMMNVKTFDAPAGMKISIETFKDGHTPPTEEDGVLVKG